MTESIENLGHLQPEELSAFIDGEVSAADAQTLRLHLETCHSCALRTIAATQLKAATAHAGERFAPSTETLARLSAQLRRQVAEAAQPNPRVPALRRSFFARSTTWGAWAALAAAILLTVSLMSWWRIRQSNALTAELLDQHLAALSSAASPQVISSDRHTVKPWFQGRLSFSFNLPEPDTLPPDTTLRGADLVYLEGQPAALLIFTIHKHQASVFVTQRNTGLALTPRTTRSGFAVRSATTPELRLLAVSDVNPSDLEALVAVVAKVQ